MGIPAKLNARHQLAARMVAAGFTDAEIAKRIGYSLNYIGLIKKAPLFQVLVREIVQEITAKATTNVAEEISRRTPRILKRWDELMEQDEDRGVAMRAVAEGLDRIAPKRSIADVDHVVHVHVDGNEKQFLDSVLVEAGEIETLDKAIEDLSHARREAENE